MDFGTAQREVRERLGELEEDFFTDAEIKRALNEAVIRFSAEARWPWLTTEGTAQLDTGEDELVLPDNVSVNRTFNLSVTGDTLRIPIELEKVEPSAGFRLRHTYATRQSAPRWYYLTGAATDVDSDVNVVYTMKLIPTADVEYDLEYQYMREPAHLDADTDKPDMPLAYHEGMVAWATGKLFLKEMSISQKSSEQFQIYGMVVEQAKNDMFHPALDETVAWGREHPGELRVPPSQRNWVESRIPPTLG